MGSSLLEVCMSDIVFIIFVVLALVVIIVQHIYIENLKKGIEYAVKILQKYETAILADDIIRKVSENEPKTDKVVSK